MANKKYVLYFRGKNKYGHYHKFPLVSLYLKKELFDTEIAYDGEAALKAVEEYKPDLIVLDIMLPGEDRRL